jgi:hypothetical protein
MARPIIVILAAVFAIAAIDSRASAKTADNSWLLVVDDLHIDFVNTGRLRSLLRAVAERLIREGDTYQLVATGPSGKVPMAAAHVIDRMLIETAIRAMTGNALKDGDVLGPASDELQVRATRALDAIEGALSTFISDSSGRKAMVYVSRGYYVDALPALADRIAALVRRARDNDVTIFSIDARGFGSALGDPPIDGDLWLRYTAATRRSLSMMADETGGFVIERPNEPAPDLQRIEAQMR